MKKIKAPTAVTTAILTLITILFWAGFQIYHSLTTKNPPSVAAEIIKPLDPSLDTNTLDEISKRIYINDNDIENLTATNGATPIPSPTIVPEETTLPSPTASQSATPTSSPTETPAP